MFEENPGGVRIDHIIGLIDPFVYREGRSPKPKEGAARLYSSPEHPELKKFAIPRMGDLNYEVGPENEFRVAKLNNDQIEKYSAILEKIVIQAALEKGIGKESIICEDLGTVTNPVLEVMEKLQLSGLRVTQFIDPEDKKHPYRIKNTEPRHWVMIGSHDNSPVVCWINEIFEKNEVEPHAEILAEDLWENNPEEFELQLVEDRKKFFTAKFAELFASTAENVQIFFADFFGMCERYNMPGTSGKENWSLRVPNDYHYFYKQQLTSGMAVNLPEILIMAIQAKGSKFEQENQDLIEKLKNISGFFSKK
jgi:4-alpha-glucanotransferase